MLIERVSIKFNGYIFDRFYTKKQEWPPEVVLYSKDNGLPLSYIEQEGLDYLVLEYKAADGWERRQLKEEDMIIMVPRYFLELFEDLEPTTIEGQTKSYYSI